jgi:hypothetical protein
LNEDRISGSSRRVRADETTHILLALIDEDRSLAELGRELDLPLNLLHYHVHRLVKLGLVKIARTERRAGAPIRRYRAAATEIFVPAELMKAPPGAALNPQLRRSIEANHIRTFKGALYEKGPRMRLVQRPGIPALELWLRMHPSDAASFSSDLRELCARYEWRPGQQRRHWLFHAALAPA